MKIIGIDPGFGLCGFAILEIKKNKNNPKLINFGVIKTKPQTNFASRLLEIAEDFEHLLKKHQPQILSIEDLFFVQNVTTGMNVAHVRGVILFLAHKFGLKIVEPKPVEVKHSFTGNGKASKTEMKKMAQILFNLKKSPKTDDSADAIAVAYFATQGIDFLI
jgi:crossover junction endodeoxyribonuclease RuvC